MKFSFLRTVLDMRVPAPVAFLAMALSACASGKADDAALTDGPRNTGQYPNINIERPAATAQMTHAEREAILRDLGAAGTARADGNGSNSASEEARLGTLAQTHGEETLRQIEAGE